MPGPAAAPETRFDRLLGAPDRLSPAESRVAAVLRRQPRWFLRAPVTEIARRAEVSPPTVVRFCRTVGAGGLPDLKLRLATELSRRPPTVHAAVDPDDSVGDVLSKVVGASVAAIERVGLSLDAALLDRAVDCLAKASRVDFIGSGQSAVVALDAKHKFFRLGLNCEAHADPAMQRMSAALLGVRDVMIAISASGTTPTILDAATIARERDATVIGLTPAASALGRRCDFTLSCGVAEDLLAHVPMLTRMQHLLVIDVLAAALALRGGSRAAERHRRLKDVLVRWQDAPAPAGAGRS